MCRNLSQRMKKNVRPAHSQLTESNLRLHSSHVMNNRMFDGEDCPTQTARRETYEDLYDDMDGSQDGDAYSKRHMLALRRAASLQALNAYGGCFASGFLAMQDPLPWRSRKSSYDDVESLDLQTLASEMSSVEGKSTSKSKKAASSNAHARAGSPRPDSDTLSQADVQEIEKMRKWSWRSLGQRRRNSGS